MYPYSTLVLKSTKIYTNVHISGTTNIILTEAGCEIYIDKNFFTKIWNYQNYSIDLLQK